MIAVDTSAVIAILWNEPTARRLEGRLLEAFPSVISAANVLELQLLLLDVGAAPSSWAEVETLFATYRIDSRPFDQFQLSLAREAALRFGKGRQKARLNYGDCFAYALAQSEGLPLLCVGDDFAQTDVEIA